MIGFQLLQKDTLILEDQSGRVALSGEIAKEVSTLVTGVMLAAKGTMNEFGEFNVSVVIVSFLHYHKSSFLLPCSMLYRLRNGFILSTPTRSPVIIARHLGRQLNKVNWYY